MWTTSCSWWSQKFHWISNTNLNVLTPSRLQILATLRSALGFGLFPCGI
jgi:hypothetical protein